ncbi:organellar and viral DNA polymerase type B [Trichomonas vaginalis G3]|uniref:organellar and viral DNA polymerase type B n=1 Tax=Trichomonas vaginalis (strain ATCC PRA-98 / G3) TaxID=412133 RepID=UPI0021E5EB75|nr:organellar and viral DNA polymerase type B [Trichomonas vaginalis G3]KAI5545004.1 organellar and viral DNA polymerase type B [Trichomonas vaginalis G3]
MSIAAYAYEADRAKRLYFGQYSLTLTDKYIVISDGNTEKYITWKDYEKFDPILTPCTMPFIVNGEVVMKNDTTVYRSVYEALESILNFNPSGFDTKTTPSTMPFIVNGEIVSKNNETVYKSVYAALNYMLHFNPSGFDPQITSCTMSFIVNGEIVMKNDTTVSKSVRDILDYLLHLGPTGFDPYTTQCQVPFINDSAEIKLKTSTVDEAIADSLTKLLDIIMRFNTFKTTYETFKKNYDDFFKITYIEPSAPQTPDYACLKIKLAMMFYLHLITMQQKRLFDKLNREEIMSILSQQIQQARVQIICHHL